MDANDFAWIVQKYIIGPLENLPEAQIKNLDDNHDQSVRDFQDALSPLFEPDGDVFQGQAADALANYIGSYLDAEEALSPYVDGSLNTLLQEMINDSATLVEQEKPQMNALLANLVDTPLKPTAEPETPTQPEVSADPGDPGPILLPLVILILGISYISAQNDQVHQIQIITNYVNQWVTDMKSLASQMETLVLEKASQLPSLPEQIEMGITLDAQQIVASTASELARQYSVPESTVQDIINKNPGLTQDEYAFLVQYYSKYGTYPYGVISILTGVDQNGKPKIYFVTKGDLKHIREHGDNLQTLSDEELLELIKKLLQGKPDEVEVDKSRKLIDYYYDNVEVNGKYITVIIRTSTSTPGRIISIYEEW